MHLRKMLKVYDFTFQKSSTQFSISWNLDISAFEMQSIVVGLDKNLHPLQLTTTYSKIGSRSKSRYLLEKPQKCAQMLHKTFKCNNNLENLEHILDESFELFGIVFVFAPPFVCFQNQSENECFWCLHEASNATKKLWLFVKMIWKSSWKQLSWTRNSFQSFAEKLYSRGCVKI